MLQTTRINWAVTSMLAWFCMLPIVFKHWDWRLLEHHRRYYQVFLAVPFKGPRGVALSGDCLWWAAIFGLHYFVIDRLVRANPVENKWLILDWGSFAPYARFGLVAAFWFAIQQCFDLAFYETWLPMRPW